MSTLLKRMFNAFRIFHSYRTALYIMRIKPCFENQTCSMSNLITFIDHGFFLSLQTFYFNSSDAASAVCFAFLVLSWH